jgi:predicted Fe-Mo cluster-binding NifX family protein
MRIAIPEYDNQVATVMDFAGRLLLIDCETGQETERKTVDFSEQLVPAKVARLVDFGVNLLICGAISRPFSAMVLHSGIEIIPFISGNVDDVLSAYFRGYLVDSRFLMPGCRVGQHWGRRGGRRGHGGFRR